MKVTEEDIFFYVSAPKKLTEEKFTYIKENESSFQNEISFFTTLLQNMQKDLPKGVLEKIKKKINNPD